jgi:hypothetical protein
VGALDHGSVLRANRRIKMGTRAKQLSLLILLVIVPLAIILHTFFPGDMRWVAGLTVATMFSVIYLLLYIREKYGGPRWQ